MKTHTVGQKTTVAMTHDDLLVTRGALMLYLEGSFADDREAIASALDKIEAAILRAKEAR